MSSSELIEPFINNEPLIFFFFFFQAEDGIRDLTVTGVQTCALPISGDRCAWWRHRARGGQRAVPLDARRIPRRLEPSDSERRSRDHRVDGFSRTKSVAAPEHPEDRKSVV